MSGLGWTGYNGPLTPEDEVYVLDISKLKVGDIILTSSPWKAESFVIRGVTGGSFSHAILVLEPPDAMESANAGVVGYRLDRFCVRSPNNILVRRVKPTCSFDAKTLSKAAESLLGVPYADMNAITSIVDLIPVVERGDFFCSQLVSHCFLEAGVQICPGVRPAKTTPALLQRSTNLEGLPNEEMITKKLVKALAFVPDLLDGANEETPNETLNLKGQRAVAGIQAKFKACGLNVSSREQAMMAVQRALKDRAPYAAELDQALAAAYREIDISSVARNFLPPDDESNFMDLKIARAILSGRFKREAAEIQIEFYRSRLPIREKILGEREDFVLAERSAYFVTGAECTRLDLAAVSEILALHRKSYEVMSRTLKVLEAFVEHDGEPIQLESAFMSLLLPGLRELMDKHGRQLSF
jgi:hypothetical protein